MVQLTQSPAWNMGEILKSVTGIITTGYPLFVGKLPAGPDACIALLDTGGPAGEVAVAIDYPTVQVLVRGIPGAGYPIAYDKLSAIRDVLVGIPSAPTQWPQLTSCVARGHMQDIGEDENKRTVFSLNLQLIVSYVSSGHREAIS